MNKSYKIGNALLVECINPKNKKYRIRWDIQPYYNNDGIEGLMSFVEEDILHKPTITEIKSIVLNGMNAIIDENIISGFVWENMPVWLSSENQFNYKAAFDLAMQTNGANLPVVFKFGSSEEPIYHKFDTLEELSDFYMKAMTYVNEQLAIGWAKKDSIDWSLYEEALNNLK